jgi:hypothetical protein
VAGVVVVAHVERENPSCTLQTSRRGASNKQTDADTLGLLEQA